ncbi:unnamed protein product [Phaedon cochleariae]|uniref:THAP4-like heme-binding domain-containing protein n=1 Tax=Phaedon cochleariae TaxID=80249 RepID=A0A9P0DSS9_PHACE|nr:unnamed protein product [Phaedon cochleariae]
MQPGKLNDIVKPLCWLMGTWKSISARVSYPTMKCPVDYCENLVFESVGQPLLNYHSLTWNPKDKSPMHLESGFLRIDQDGCSVSFLIAQNFGIATVEEGCVEGSSISTESKSIGSTNFIKGQVVAIHRNYCLNEQGQLVFKMKLQTPKVPLTDHLHVVYEKEDCKPEKE